jgi:long-chain fatty acid transport protein
MRKILTFIAGTLIAGNLLAGGLVTNTNQSASWVRMPSRNATTEIDAVYNNPAGLMKLENGFHFSLSNQTIFQTRTITSSYPYLNQSEYKGTVSAPIFPSIYAVYKMKRLAFSLGFMPIGGGGGATYEDGLPSFEMGQSDLVPALATSFGVSEYRMDVFFEGSSVFFGYQGAVSFKINDWISVAAGARYVTAKSTYDGYLRDVQVNSSVLGGWVDATVPLGLIADNAHLGGTNLQPVIDGGAGGFTADQLVAASQMTPAQRDAIVNGLTSLGVPGAASLTISQSQTAFFGAEVVYDNKATLLADQEASVEQTGSGITPFFSVNISPIKNLNVSIKYEMATKLELTNSTTKDLTTGFLGENPAAPITKFPDGEKFRNDMPAMLAIGAEFQLSKIKLAAGGNYYFDKSSDYGHTHDATPATSTDLPVAYTNSDIIESNGLAFHCGAEFNLSDKLLVSGGYAWGNLGVNKLYQSDLTFANATHTIGLGGAYTIKNKIRLNLGAAYTMYVADEKNVDHYLGATNLLPLETYTKTTLIIGVGLDIRF